MILAIEANNLRERALNLSLEEKIIKAAKEGKNSITINRSFIKQEKDEMIKLGYKVTREKVRSDYRVDDTVYYNTIISW